MRNIVGILAIALFFMTGCTGVKTVTSGMENEAFLEFVGNTSQYEEGVEVNLNDEISFKAEVNKPHANRPKGQVYAISPGTHILTVSSKDKVVYRKKIFVSAQETRKVELP